MPLMEQTLQSTPPSRARLANGGAAPYRAFVAGLNSAGDDLVDVLAAVVGPFGQEADVELIAAGAPCPRCGTTVALFGELCSLVREIESCGACGVVLAA